MRANTLLVIKILEKYSNSYNPLSINQIVKLVMHDFFSEVSPKTVKRILQDLVYSLDPDVTREIEERMKPLLKIYEVKRDESALKSFCKENKISESGGIPYNAQIWYIIREFDDSELSLLIDGLLFSSYIPYSQCKSLIKKLKGLSSEHFKIRHDSPFNAPENNHNFLLTMDDIREAIERRLKINFNLMLPGIDKKLHPVYGKDNKLLEYKEVSPYEIAIQKNRFYLFFSYDKGPLYHFRLDYLHNVKIMEERRDKEEIIIEPQQLARPLADVPGFGHKLDIAKYLGERVYMFSGESKRVVIRANKNVTKNIIGHILDWLGKDVILSDEGDGFVTVTAKTNLKALFFWSMQYGASVEILEPPELRKEIRETLRGMMEKYDIVCEK